MNPIQKEYELIKEGKGNKDHFLKLARLSFPNYVGTSNTYDQAVVILKGKSLLSEGVGGIVSITNETPDWFKLFEAEVKAELKKTDKEVVDMETKDFDYKDVKNIDNLYGQAFLVGYYVEMEDPKNAKKTVEELKGIVAKNLAKDMNFYVKNSAFGLKIKGYQDDVPGAGKIEDAKGKYKSSGYGDLKESKYSLMEMMGVDEIQDIEEGPMDQKIAAAEKKVEDLQKQVAKAKLELANVEKQAADASAKI
jgi:hypothetical protein